MNNKTASAPSKTTSPTEITLIKCSPGGHVSKRCWGAVILASDFSALRVLLSDCIKDAILRWLIDHPGYDGAGEAARILRYERRDCKHRIAALEKNTQNRERQGIIDLREVRSNYISHAGARQARRNDRRRLKTEIAELMNDDGNTRKNGSQPLPRARLLDWRPVRRR